MSEQPHDIKDDEIRIITSGNNPEASRKGDVIRSHRPFITISIIAAIICIVGVCCIVFSKFSNDNSEELELVTNDVIDADKTTDVISDSIDSGHAKLRSVVVSDTTVNRVGLSIFRPVNLIPTLHIGTDVLNDSTARFVVQAADVRDDNGGIVGAFVDKGSLISKGQAKSGFCAIVGGKITIGVADATSLLEQALETDGYFFRQYPLVVAGQIVENKPKGKSLRKALGELGGEEVVIMSRGEMTFHDFSQSLVDLGVTNAIYLVGGKGYGFAIDADNNKIEFGQRLKHPHQNSNYIVWR